VYIESGAWATNFKQKLASGSPVFAIDPRAPEFFSRALRPGVHYAPLRVADMCNQTVATVRPASPASGVMHQAARAALTSSVSTRQAAHASGMSASHACDTEVAGC
jgi:Glycosyl transferase family 90